MHNWAGNRLLPAKEMRSPTSLDDLRRIVAESQHVGMIGAGHSFSDVFGCRGTLVQLDRWQKRVSVDPESHTAEVSAGMTHGDVAERLHAAGWALGNMLSLPHVTVAGAVATGSHGSGVSQSGLAHSVRAVTYVMADGAVRRWSAEEDGEAFFGTVVAMGALGVATELTISVEAAFNVVQTVRTDVSMDEVAARLDEILTATYSVSVFTDWSSQRANVWLKRRTNDPDPSWNSGRRADVMVPPVVGGPTDTLTPQLGVPGPWYMRIPHVRTGAALRSGTELQSEYMVPRETAPRVLTELSAAAPSFTDALQVSEIRIVKGDGHWMSPSYGCDCVAFHFTWMADASAVAQAIGAVESVLGGHHVRPHWGKLFGLPLGSVVDEYENAGRFGDLVRAEDPYGKFRTGLVGDLLDAAGRGIT